MKYILQVFTGSWHKPEVQPENVIGKIDELSSRIGISRVIIGWNTDASACRKIGAFLHGKGMEMLLWLPVFSESGTLAETDEAVDLFGNPARTPAGQEAESFRFVCPSSPHNLQTVKDIYETYFSGCGFDGVFLDRIRSQSFASGVSGVFSCGCERCRAAFLKKGVDPEKIRELYEEKEDAFFDLASWPMNGEFILEDPLAQRFFEVKEEIIADAAADLIRYFRSRGMTVGLDLFAPFVSRIVGQRYPLIAKDADFIKPMLYRRTDAPAGIGYECAAFKKAAPKAQGPAGITTDRAFLDAQLEAARRAPCRVCPGIEINHADGIVETDAAYVTESLTAVRDHGFEEAVLCWNAIQAPETHIEAVAGMND